MRFRNYLAEQYKKEDTLNNEKVVLPITTIYILGFKLPEIETACLKVERTYVDHINKTILNTKSDFVEKLTHDSYIVQVERITNSYQTKLEKLLSIFEQTNFVDDKKIIKEFTHQIDFEEMKLTTDILHYSGTNLDEKKKIETEQEAWRTVDAMTGGLRDKVEQQNKALIKKDEALNEKDKLIAELLLKLNEKKYGEYY